MVPTRPSIDTGGDSLWELGFIDGSCWSWDRDETGLYVLSRGQGVWRVAEGLFSLEKRRWCEKCKRCKKITFPSCTFPSQKCYHILKQLLKSWSRERSSIAGVQQSRFGLDLYSSMKYFTSRGCSSLGGSSRSMAVGYGRSDKEEGKKQAERKREGKKKKESEREGAFLAILLAWNLWFWWFWEAQLTALESNTFSLVPEA